MATVLWRGDAVPVAQVGQVAILSDDSTTTYALTINGKAVSTLGAGTGVSATATLLQAAVAASTIPEFLELTSTVSSSTIAMTAATAGIPFTVAASVSGGTGTIGSVTTTTASSGPNDWSTAANWTTGAVPVNGDSVYFQNSSSAATYGLAQSTVTLTLLSVDSTYTGTIGLPRYNANGGYLEYRPTYLAIGTTTCNLGGGSGSGSGRIKLNAGSVQALWTVLSAGTPADQGLPAVILQGTHASNVLNTQQGQTGVAIEAGQTSTVATVRIGYLTSPATDAIVTLGAGCTLTTINQNGGTLAFSSNVTTLTMNNGITTVSGTAAVTSLNVQDGTTYYEAASTITAATVGTNGTLDLSQDPRAKTITNLTLAAQSTFLDPNKVVTFTNPFVVQNCALSEIALNIGSNFSLQRS